MPIDDNLPDEMAPLPRARCDAAHDVLSPTPGIVFRTAMEAPVPWYNIVNRLPDGRRELLVRIKCANDRQAADDLSADMFPGAEVWEGTRFVAALPPEHFPRGEQADGVVRVRPS